MRSGLASTSSLYFLAEALKHPSMSLWVSYSLSVTVLLNSLLLRILLKAT
jgi:hypothetical protein